MTCAKVQSLITPFINDELNLDELDEFIEHVRSCPECREELEVYYALLTAMKQLDEDRNLSEDYSMELSAKLDREQERIIHIKFTRYRKRGILIFIILLLAFIINFRQSVIIREEEPPNSITESKFRLRTEFNRKRYETLGLDLLEKTAIQGVGTE